MRRDAARMRTLRCIGGVKPGAVIACGAVRRTEFLDPVKRGTQGDLWAIQQRLALRGDTPVPLH
jgi:hypothetical protein